MSLGLKTFPEKSHKSDFSHLAFMCCRFEDSTTLQPKFYILRKYTHHDGVLFGVTLCWCRSAVGAAGGLGGDGGGGGGGWQLAGWHDKILRPLRADFLTRIFCLSLFWLWFVLIKDTLFRKQSRRAVERQRGRESERALTHKDAKERRSVIKNIDLQLKHFQKKSLKESKSKH